MQKRVLCLLLILVLLISMSSFVFAENEGEEIIDPAGFTVQAIHREYKESIDKYPMVLTLTNNTENDVTVTGNEKNQLTIWVKPNPHPMAEKEPFLFNLYGDAEEITVKASETKEIVEVPTGGTDCWNAFYHPKLVEDMDVVINIKSENKESQEATFLGVYYAIKGEMRNPLYIGEIISTDNEDGTATLEFTLTAFDEINEFVCKDKRCEELPQYKDMECCVIETMPEEIGPKTGLQKSDFSVQKEGELLGEIIQAKEIAEGKYELVWQHEAGEYEGILLNTASNYGDFFVCNIPKDDKGNYNFNERDYTFDAKITHTKEPIVIKHDGATLETAGATNIPKFVNLFFKEITEEIDKDTMGLLEKNIEEATVNKEIVHIYDISLLLDGEEIQPNGPVKITIPLDDKMKKYLDLKVIYISDTGEVTEVDKVEITDDEISFFTDHFSYYAVLGTPKDEADEDVPEPPKTNEDADEDVPEPPKTNEDADEGVPESPKTGDNAIYYALFIGIMALLGIGIVLKKEYSK